MSETKRAPTDLEIQHLLRNAARKAEDEAAIGDYLLSARRRVRLAVSDIVLIVGVTTVFAFSESMRSWPGGAALLACAVALGQAVEIGRLTRVTGALARTIERERAAEPLPRAPSPPAT